MFNTSQLEFINHTVSQMYNQGYVYYVVHTNTNLNSSDNWRDITLYFSKNEIKTLSMTRYSVYNAIKYDVMSGNANRNNNHARVSKTTVGSTTISINDYEFVSTNAIGSEVMNVLAREEYQYDHTLNYNMTMNDYYLVPIILSIILLYNWLCRIFPSFGKVEKL